MTARFMLRITTDNEIENRWSDSCLCLISIARRIRRFDHLEIIDTTNDMIVWQAHNGH